MSSNRVNDGRQVTLANILTGFRVIAAPVMVGLALAGQPVLVLCLISLSFLTDAVDGAIARLSGGPTAFGARFDSIADAIAYSAIGICVILLWPDVVRQEIPAFLAVAVSLALPAAFGLIKFGQLTSYHTVLVKFAVGAVAIGLLLLLLGYAAWPFRAAAVLAVLSAIEEIFITFLLREPRSDIGSICVAWRSWRSS